MGAPGESHETTHISVVDASGNAVSLTTTLNAGFGSGIVARGTGVLLNNEMDDFAAKPGVPNLYGLVGALANAIEPGKRPLSSMSPTIVLEGGRPALVLGSPGGSRIITGVVQVILNTIVFEMPVAQAVTVPRIHHQWLPDEIWVEPFGLAPETRRDLEGLGHAIRVYDREELGRVNAVQVTPEGCFAGPDVRGGCVSAGY
jgi:gamma-glutamyltranspeptidase/glutathione hydrolase